MNGLLEVSGPAVRRSELRVLLKDETRNESGSHKQRAAAAVVAAARGQGHCAVTTGSCGNYGVALAIAAAQVGMSATIVLPHHADGSRLVGRLREVGAAVHLAGDDYEGAVEASKHIAVADGLADGNVDGPYSSSLLQALSAIASEVIGTVTEPPGSIWVPTGNGTTVAAIGLGLAAAAFATAPVAVTIRGNNSILASWPSRTHRPIPAGLVTTTPVRDPLVNHAALHGQEALDVLHDRSGHILGVRDEDLIAAQALLASEGVECSLSGAAGLAGLLASPPGRREDGTAVVVVTGR